MKKDLKIARPIYNKLLFEARKRQLTADELAEIAIQRELKMK